MTCFVPDLPKCGQMLQRESKRINTGHLLFFCTPQLVVELPIVERRKDPRAWCLLFKSRVNGARPAMVTVAWETFYKSMKRERHNGRLPRACAIQQSRCTSKTRNTACVRSVGVSKGDVAGTRNWCTTVVWASLSFARLQQPSLRIATYNRTHHTRKVQNTSCSARE